jgi:hypothetical protein
VALAQLNHEVPNGTLGDGVSLSIESSLKILSGSFSGSFSSRPSPVFLTGWPSRLLILVQKTNSAHEPATGQALRNQQGTMQRDGRQSRR